MFNTPLLACGSFHIGPGTAALIFALVGGWFVSAGLAIVNPLLIASLRIRTGRAMVHGAVYTAYVAPGLALFTAHQGMDGRAVGMMIIGVPVLAISHFIILLWLRRQQRFQVVVPAAG